MYLIDINVSAEIDEYPSLRFQDIRKKSKCHGWTDGHTDGQRENSIPHHKQSLRGYYNVIIIIIIRRNFSDAIGNGSSTYPFGADSDTFLKSWILRFDEVLSLTCTCSDNLLRFLD